MSPPADEPARIEPLAKPYPEAFAAAMARTMPPGAEPLVLFTTIATSPRASTGKMATFARRAALVVARSCAWLSTPFSRNPLPKYTRAFFSDSDRSIDAAV